MYLSEAEFRILAQLSEKPLTNTPYSVPPFGIDVFEEALQGLDLAEAEFDSTAAFHALTLPSMASDSQPRSPRGLAMEALCAAFVRY